MTTYPNGELPDSALSEIAPGERLAGPSANAYRALVAAGKAHGISIRLAAGVGSAYRSLSVQRDYWDAYNGNAAAAKRVGLNPASRIRVAQPRGSSHGFGTRADLLFNGSSSPDAADLALAKQYGWTREFGADDPNHFEHDGRTAISSTASSAPTSTTVRSGEGGIAVAGRVGISFAQLQKLNPGVANWGALELGQKLRIR